MVLINYGEKSLLAQELRLAAYKVNALMLSFKELSINSSQQRDSVIFKPSLRTDTRAHGSATLGTNNRNSGGKGVFRKHNRGSTLMS